MQLRVDKGNFTKEDMEMTTYGHVRGSNRSHNQRRENAKAIEKIRMSQEELDREFTELKERLSISMEILQERKEDHRCGWILKRKAK